MTSGEAALVVMAIAAVVRVVFEIIDRRRWRKR